MRVLQFIGAILLFFAAPAMASGGSLPWTVTQKSGDVRVLKNGLQPASVQVRAALSPGDVVATGANGRVMLTRGDDYVVVAPASRLLLPKGEQAKGFTRLIQQVGTMLYKVRHTGVPHFAVETPMLAAVVKGTSFTVVVDKDRAAVQVTEGLVEVSAATGHARRLVEGGVTVYIGRERPDQIIEMKPGSPSLPGSGSGSGEAVRVEASGDVPLASISDLTGGLVREAPVAPVAAVATAPAAANVLAPAPTNPSAGASVGTAAPASNPVAPVTGPVVDVVEATVPTVVEPVVEVVEATVPAVVEPVVDIVESTVPTVVEPVIEIVETTVPVVTAPVIEIVESTVPVVTAPVVEIVETVIPTVVEPVVAIVEPIVPVVVAPVVEIVQTTVPVITQPIGSIVGGLFGGP